MGCTESKPDEPEPTNATAMPVNGLPVTEGLERA